MKKREQSRGRLRAVLRAILPGTAVLWAWGLPGCAVGPEFRPPEMPVPEAWSREVPEARPQGDAAGEKGLPESTQAWWDEFCDEDMERLIARLIEANPDLHRARARIDEALAQRRTHVAGRLPHADFTGRTESGLADFDGDGRITRLDPRPTRDFGQVDFGWEMDLFGEHARRIEASGAQARATVEAWRDVLVFLIGEVGLFYTDMRTNEERARVAEEFVAVYEEVLRVSVEREQGGASSQLQTEEARARLELKRSEVPDFRRQAEQARHRLARLLASGTSDLSALLSSGGTLPAPPRAAGAGVPAEVLRARPDIRGAEDRIAAQVARVGEATAQLYPSLHLSGALTYESIASGGTTELLTRTIGGGGTVLKRLFHAGADKARVAEQDALLQQAIRGYEAAVLTAINEVEDALADLHYGRQRLAALERATTASQSASQRIREAYALGLVEIGELLRVLDDDFEIQTEHLFARNLLAKGGVRLYKAAGGGQLPLPPDQTPENLVATEYPGLLRPLSVLFSLGADERFTLHARRLPRREGTPRDGSEETAGAPVDPDLGTEGRRAALYSRAFSRTAE